MDNICNTSLIELLINIYSISNTVKEYVKEEYKLNSKVIINGINVHKIDNLKKGNKSDKLRIVQVSTLNHEIKGQHILIEAIKLVKEKGYNVSADFIGDGHSFDYLYNLTKENDFYLLQNQANKQKHLMTNLYVSLILNQQ